MGDIIDTVDRISLLPEFIVHKILSNLLDSPEALVRMSVLKDFEWDDNYMRDAFLKNIAYTTFRFCKQNVSANTLTIVTDLSKPIDVKIVEDCLESVLKKGLCVLKIDISYAGNMPMLLQVTEVVVPGSPLKSFNDFLSNFPIMENLSLALTSPCNHMKLSNHSLRRFELLLNCDLEEVDINTPNLLLFEYYGKLDRFIYTPFHWEKLSQSKGCTKCYPDDESVDTLWFQKLRFLDKKVLKLILEPVFL
ncbi:hypothetical protein Tco_0209433 [Tanacetum coccineum]